MSTQRRMYNRRPFLHQQHLHLPDRFIIGLEIELVVAQFFHLISLLIICIFPALQHQHNHIPSLEEEEDDDDE